MKLKKVIVELIVILYASLFIYTAISKLMDYDLSREQLATMPLVGPISGVVVWLLPVSEILLALLIFWPQSRLKGLYLGTSLMLTFTLYVAYLMKFHNSTPCTCGGFLQSLSWPQHLLFNTGFVLIGCIAIFLEHKSKERSKITNQPAFN
ncbi:MauE/DoxX family redox-associated membrane protein [Filimonas effusa]|uniref:Methylamine utilisation protein MauE domain-containing protein n=1 Tax=Filimonas effusa TaxID=2508721 RepID=A0A4Q1D377_9BACT|nr:MauE/DoxX family redox-associated membrane protein [Filimonas effusa]RXK81749.1 hypothetical protein ESB13_18320 [Filimonas effusa]